MPKICTQKWMPMEPANYEIRIRAHKSGLFQICSGKWMSYRHKPGKGVSPQIL
jgi:hypothetical protein